MCERYIKQLLLTRPQLGTWPATQACALTGNRTSDSLVPRLALSPLSHTSQGRNKVTQHEVCSLSLGSRSDTQALLLVPEQDLNRYLRSVHLRYEDDSHQSGSTSAELPGQRHGQVMGSHNTLGSDSLA